MERTIHFIAGLPRSGSTLLCNLLAQNPRFHTTSTSGIVSVVRIVRENWARVFGPDQPASEATRRRIMGAILQRYHDDPNVPKPVVFDKSRGWLGNLDLAEMALGRKVKVLVCVRDIRDVLASFERLWRKNAATWGQPQELEFNIAYQSVEGRCDVLMRPNQVVGGAYQRIKRALGHGRRDRMYFVEFEKITANPKRIVKEIYEFLEEPAFPHDFENVEQVTSEDDFMHGIPGLHVIRSKVEPVPSQWPKYLGPFAQKYAPYNNLWRGSAWVPELPSEGETGEGEAGEESAKEEEGATTASAQPVGAQS